jgi:hypothetical protein
MAKQSGLGDNFYVTGYNLSGDTANLGRLAAPLATLDVTGIDKSAMERIGGHRDGAMEWTTYFNNATAHAHPVLKALPAADIIATYARGTAVGSPAACLLGKQINYDPTRAADGSLTAAVQVQANSYGIEWGQLLTTGAQTLTGADDGASIDTAASADFGAQAYLHVFDIQGTDATVKLQGSTDDSSWGDITGGAFTALGETDDHTAERIATSATETIPRYVRVSVETTGGFTSLTFAVVVVKNKVAVVF